MMVAIRRLCRPLSRQALPWRMEMQGADRAKGTVWCLAGIAATLAVLGGCGGGGGASETQSAGPSAAFGTPFACSEASALATAQFTAPIATQTFNWESNPSVAWVLPSSVENWNVQIDGQAHTLVVRVVPPTDDRRNGVVMFMHGHSELQATLTAAALDDMVWNAFWANRGYFVVHVARRGNFGSSGDRLFDVERAGLLAKYQAGAIGYSDIAFASWKYQADSMVAALTSMAGEARFQPALSSIVLAGFSGGAPTALHVAYASAVFKAATHRAVLRFTGRDSARDSNPDAAPGEYRYTAGIAVDNVPVLWMGGGNDTTTAKGKLACEFAAWDAKAQPGSSFHLIPDGGHLFSWDALTDQTYPILLDYLSRRGFVGL